MDDQAFRVVIWAHVQQIKKSGDSFSKKKLREALLVTLRKWTDGPARYASAAALELAKQQNVNLADKLWKDRRCLDSRKGLKHSALVWEHTTPLSEAMPELLSCNTEKEVEQWMKSYSGVCWLTREEDRRLQSFKYGKARPGGWEKCYEDCNIEIKEFEPK